MILGAALNALLFFVKKFFIKQNKKISDIFSERKYEKVVYINIFLKKLKKN
ncbi:MAG: hypothetical protein K6B15_02135 [Parasporobacterium sp.]|nr:hypothetical protein [Parasporobacterium sp.]